MQKGKAHVIIDGQFGSTGKGLLAAYLAQRARFDVCTTNASANAGHTTVLENGEKFVCYHLPTAGVMQNQSTIYLNAGSIIDPTVLALEASALGISAARIVVDPNAAIIRPEDRATEGAASSPATAIGSTQKGVGEALVRKARRHEDAVAGKCVTLLPPGVRVERIDLNERLRDGGTVMVEIPQGAGLGINTTHFYPYCTSREVSVMQGLADALIHPEHLGDVVMSLRTYPIRVGNIWKDNQMLGWSGPGYSDQQELDWKDIGVEPEITTVTKRERRVFDWSSTQIRHVFGINRPTLVFLNFCNYLKTPADLRYRVNDISRHIGRDHFRMLFGFGPKVSDIVDSYPEALERVEASRAAAQ